MLSHWRHVATHVATQVAQLVARHVFQWNRSHWRHVATHVATQVADAFSSARQFHSPEVAAARRLVAESFHTGDMCGDLCGDMCGNMCRQCESTITRPVPTAGQQTVSDRLNSDRLSFDLTQPWSSTASDD